eukprot:scaffold95399_cov31-Tisochrysis_lutea.AAC.2
MDYAYWEGGSIRGRPAAPIGAYMRTEVKDMGSPGQSVRQSQERVGRPRPSRIPKSSITVIEPLVCQNWVPASL